MNATIYKLGEPILVRLGEATMTALTKFQKELLSHESRIQPLRKEAGPVILLRGHEVRSAYILQAKGLVEVFTLSPYNNYFMRLVEPHTI